MKTNGKDNDRYPGISSSMLSHAENMAMRLLLNLYNHSYRWNWDSDSCQLLDMSPFGGKYHQTKGTHCWFCEREFIVAKQIFVFGGDSLMRTREHIIPRSAIIFGNPKNYIASCKDCNCLKGRRNAKDFALYLEELISTKKQGKHNMWKFLPLMRDRAWKLYNKTSKLHNTYEKIYFDRVKNKLLKKYKLA